MFHTNSKKLPARVAAVNLRNETANRVLPKIFAAVQPFVGQKISLKTGGWAKAFEKAIKDFSERKSENGKSYQVWITSNQYNFSVGIRASAWDEDVNESAENAYYLGKMEESGTVLRSLEPADTQKTDYKLEEIIQKMNAANQAEDEWEKKKSEIPSDFK